MPKRIRLAPHVLVSLALLVAPLAPVPADAQEPSNVFKAGERIAKPRPPGRWRYVGPAGESQSPDDQDLTDEQRAELERLRSIGYLTGSTEAPQHSGVTVHEASAYAGYNLFTSGHRPGAALMDMDGTVLHEWEADFLDVWPEMMGERLNDNTEYWRFARLCENGDLLAIFEAHGLVKLDKDSNVLWSRLGGEHHEVAVADDGTIYSLARVATTATRVRPGKPILEDFVVVLDEDGHETSRVSVLDAFMDSEYSYIFDETNYVGDILHTNAIVILEDGMVEGAPEFRDGSVLLSLRTPNTLVVLDLEREEITWVGRGEWRSQHDPSVLPGGTVLLFDNKGNEGSSRLIEMDPLTGEHVWTYAGAEPSHFESQTCGTAQRLANGNTLTAESDRGRVLEVTPDGEVVWEYVNPARAGENDEFIATIFEIERLPLDFPLDWMHGATQGGTP